MLATDHKSPYIIAETAFHHEGDYRFLENLVSEMLKKKEISAIKFHLLLDIDDYFIRSHQAYDVLSNWMFTEQQWGTLIRAVTEAGKQVILLCNDPSSVRFATQQAEYVSAIEIHATGINDHFLLKAAASFPSTVALGVGGCSIEEIQYAMSFLKQLGKTDILLMYGFQNYPTNYEDINLRKMIRLKELFDVQVGYADHTDPNDKMVEYVGALGAALGVSILEKHVTTHFGEKRTDGQAAVTFDQLRATRELMMTSMKALGDGGMEMSEGEKAYGKTGTMKKAIVARRPISQGACITLDDIAFKRTNSNTYMPQSALPKLIGLKARRDIEQDEMIHYDSVEYEYKSESLGQFFVKNGK